MNEKLQNLIIELTLPSDDNGRVFTRTDRLTKIQDVLKNSQYALLGDSSLAYIYKPLNYSSERPTILLSAHIDSIYRDYFSKICDNEIRGTFDNSACNAMVLYLMKNNRLPSQVLVAFTGDEENNSRGVGQAIEILEKNGQLFKNLELVISLDLTEEAFGNGHYSVENYFVKEDNNSFLLKFNNENSLKDYLLEILGPCNYIQDAEEDESWEYDEFDLNCFSFCLPCRVLGEDMHDDLGVAILSESLDPYANALELLTTKISRNLEIKSTERRPN